MRRVRSFDLKMPKADAAGAFAQNYGLSTSLSDSAGVSYCPQVEERKKLYSAIVHGYKTSGESQGQPLADEVPSDGERAAVGSTPSAPTWSPSAPSSRQPLPPFKRPGNTGKPFPSPVQPIKSPVQPISSPLKPFTSYVQQSLPSTPSTTKPDLSTQEKTDGVFRRDTEADLPEVTTEEIGADEVKTKSPLAGPNVMNVVMVAAECAPWSKTGLGLKLFLKTVDKALVPLPFLLL